MANTSLLSRASNKIERQSLTFAKRTAHTIRALSRARQPPQVVFLGGVQRSGTNMILDVLDRSLETEVFREADPRAFVDYKMRPPDVVHDLVDASPAPVVVVKALLELQDLKALLDDFAPAKALWPVRIYADMVNSYLEKWQGLPEQIGRILQDPDYDEWRGSRMSEETRATVSQVYRPDLDEGSAAALFWYFRNALFFEQGFDKDPRVLVMRYESLVTKPDEEFRRVCGFLGLPYSRRLTRKIFASSIGRKPVPPIDARVEDLCRAMLARFDRILNAPILDAPNATAQWSDTSEPMKSASYLNSSLPGVTRQSMDARVKPGHDGRVG